MHDKLIKYLEENEIGHNAFARKIKTPPPTLNRILRQKKLPSLKIAIMIDKYTQGEISVFDWFSGIEPHNNIHQKTRKKNKSTDKNKKNKPKL
jgi:hypothetical protein